MTTTQSPIADRARTTYLTALGAERSYMVTNAREVMENADDLNPRVVEYAQAILDAAGESTLVLPGNVSLIEDNSRRKPAGAPASNQYGTFKVHAASEAQIRFIKRLAEERGVEIGRAHV